jgi:4-coumarate--CoA ligase
LTRQIVPTHLTDWDWLFDSDFSPLRRFSDNELCGYTNAVTKERVNWRQVAEYSTYICTALVKKYGLKEGQTVSLFSQNSIWYPVVMFGVLRAGKLLWVPGRISILTVA